VGTKTDTASEKSRLDLRSQNKVGLHSSPIIVGEKKRRRESFCCWKNRDR
jgi:hypothetical protein